MQQRLTYRLPASSRIAALSLAMLGCLALILAACQPIVLPAELEQAAPPTAEPVPPDVDRVGFPTDYLETYSTFYEFDRPENKSARVIYANDVAASVSADEYGTASIEPGKPFPYGSVLVMEVHRTVKDDAGDVVLDEDGRFARDELFGLFVMRKEAGFGARYGSQRNGEWEYAAYRPDGSVLTPPERTMACAACHMEAGQGRDWVFGAERAFGKTTPEPAENEVILADYQFTPNVITVTVGREVTWTNKDVLFHLVMADDGSFGSGMLRQGASFKHTFEEAGEYSYFCAVHPNMRGTVIVLEAE